MKVRSIARNFAEAFKSISRNKMMSLSSVVIVAACLFIVLLMFCLVINVDGLLGEAESDVGITVYVDNAVSSDDLNVLYTIIRNNEHVLNVTYITRDEQLQQWIENNKLDESLFSGGNPLRRSFSITLDSGESIMDVVDWLKSPEMTRAGVANVNHAADLVETISKLSNVIRAVCLVIIGLLGVLSIVIITNTIKLTIDNRKSEISIMKYIGSTDWFIRWPFVLEGMVLGIAGSIVPVAVFTVFYDRAIKLISENYLYFLTSVNLRRGIDIFPVLVPVVIALGGAIGTLASAFTIRKYLDV